MTKVTAERIVKGIVDKIKANTADIDDWAEFWGFTREEYEEFLDMAVKALEQQDKIEQILDNFGEAWEVLEMIKEVVNS